MKKRQLCWASDHAGWMAYEWGNVIFSDKVHFEVHGYRSVVVRQSNSEPIQPGHIQQAPKHPKMYWGSFTAKGPGWLVNVEGMINSRLICFLWYIGTFLMEKAFSSRIPLHAIPLEKCHILRSV